MRKPRLTTASLRRMAYEDLVDLAGQLAADARRKNTHAMVLRELDRRAVGHRDMTSIRKH